MVEYWRDDSEAFYARRVEGTQFNQLHRGFGTKCLMFLANVLTQCSVFARVFGHLMAGVSKFAFNVIFVEPS